MALAFQRGADPYCVYNTLDADFRPLSFKLPCPGCMVVKAPHRRHELCQVCGGREFYEVPRDEPGEPTPPPSARRLRNFIYGISMALEERDVQKAGGKPAAAAG